MKKLDIEKLLHWAFRDELPKQSEPAFGRWHPRGNGSSWKLVLKYGAYGTIIDESKCHGQIGDQMGTEPRLPIFMGEPHPDSLAIAKATSGLPRPSAALITMHSKMGTRPDWLPDPIRVSGIRDGSRVRIVGKNIGRSRGHSYYSEGSYCPLQWEPSADDITHARHEYRCWHDGLVRLVEQLTGALTAHCPQMPKAPAAPWLEPATTSRILTAQKYILTQSVESLTGY